MRLGIVADTHDNVDAVRAAVDRFEDLNIDVILHCGDVIAPPVVPEFEGFEVHLVFGNNDGERTGLRTAVGELGNGSTCHGRFAHLEFDGVRIAMLHGEDLSEVDAHARSGTYDYVLHGHHHEIRREDVGEAVILNPGGHFPTIPAEHRGIAMIDTTRETDELIRLQGSESG